MMVRLLKRLSVVLVTLLLLIIGMFNIIITTTADDTLAIRGEFDEEGYIFTINDYGLDENNDTSYDNLYLSLGLNLNTTGNYDIYANLRQSGVDASDSHSADFTVGKHYIEFSFDGEQIFLSTRDGPYIVTISVYMDTDLLTDFEYETEDYSYEDFNPNPITQPTEKESIEVVNNTIMLKTEVFVAVIYELTPMIIFYYSTDEGRVARFKVTYQRIICFDDDGDNKFQSSELRYSADLQNSHWSSRKVLIEDYNSFDFSVQSVVTLRNFADQIMNTKLKITFHYASPSFMNEQKTGQKFDISIDILGGSLKGITHIALEHTLEDEQANHLFLEKESEEETSITFITPDNKERGYYSWKNSFDTKTELGESNVGDVDYNLESTNNDAEMKLYLNYPYSPEIIELFHDPEVGVDPENAPPLPGKIPPKIINHEILIYLLVAIIAAVVMIGNIYRQKSRKEED
jgi:hypothetical protein